MKILFITATYTPTVNGVSIHIKDLKRQLEKIGHKVFVLAPKFPGFNETEENIFRYFSMPNPFTNTYPIGIPIYSIDLIKKICPDVIHTHHPLIIGKYAARVSEKLKVPLFTAHTQYHQYLNYYFPRGYQIGSRIITNDLKKLSEKCSRVICPSIETQNRLNKMGVYNTEKLTNGIDTEKFKMHGNSLHNELTIIYTGRLDREKNPLLMIRVANELKKKISRFKLIIVGDGILFNRMSAMIQKFHLENDILLTGNINHDILPNIYNGADMFFTPSKTEVMPLSILEAEACGLPVISVEKSGLGEIVKHNHSGLLLKEKPGLIANEIIRLYKDKDRLKTFSEESRRIAEENSLSNYAHKLIEIYRS